jgi:flagellin-like protein
MIRKKRGLSPVIATVLLISIALVLAIIIFLWARSFIGEGLEKEGRAIDKSCENVVFRAEASVSGGLDIENLGNVAIYGVEIRTIDSSAGTEIKQSEEFPNTLTIDRTANVNLPLGVGSGNRIVVVPILLGEKGDQTGIYVCDKDYGFETTVN